MTVLKASSSNPKKGGASFSLKNRLTRVLWKITWLLLARWTPPFMHAWRRQILRVFGAKIASNAKVYSSVDIWYPPNLRMDEYSCLGPHVNCYCMDEVHLEAQALVSQNATLCAGTHDIDDLDFQLITRPIRIRSNAWIASNAFVGPGVTVEEGATLGACAVTMKDLEAWSVYVGNPAKFIRKRRQYHD